jgi:hypothetical protein
MVELPHFMEDTAPDEQKEPGRREGGRPAVKGSSDILQSNRSARSFLSLEGGGGFSSA